MEIAIGREKHNDILVEAPSASRFHCRVRLDQKGRMFILDLDSLNGTFVNGARITEEKILAISDMVQIGDKVFKGQDFLDKFNDIEQDRQYPSYDMERNPAMEYSEMTSRILKIVDEYFAKNLEKAQALHFGSYSDDILRMALEQYHRSVDDLVAMLTETSHVSEIACEKRDYDLTTLINFRVRKANSSTPEAIRLNVAIEKKKEAIEKSFSEMKSAVLGRLNEVREKYAEVNQVFFKEYYDMASEKENIWSQCKHDVKQKMPKAYYMGERRLGFVMFDENWELSVHEYGRFINHCNIIARYDKSSHNDCIDFVNGLVLRLYMAMSPGQVIVSEIDADTMEGTSQHFKRLDHRVYNIVSRQSEITDLLAKQSLHVENILHNVLIGNYDNLLDYNEGKETKESYEVIIVNGFPKGLWSDTSSQLRKLMQNGVRAGVHIILLVDDDALNDSSDLKKVYAVLSPDSFSNVCLLDFTGNQFPFVSYPVKQSHFEPCRFSQTQIQNVVNSVNKGFEVKEETVLRLSDYLPSQDEWWTSRSSSMVDIPFGMSRDKQITGLKITQESGQNSALVIGIPGSGKSAFLHSVILNSAVKYSPDELNLYLLDFSGVEFNTYALHHLPHARVIAPEAEREFGLSVLRELKEEGIRRMNLCRENDVTNIVELRNQHPELYMPRLLVIIDEFQKLFEVENDKISREANSIIHIIIQEFRKFGINLILATQRLPSNGILPKDLIANRIVFKSQPNDFSSLISHQGGQSIPFLYTGECIYNSESGAPFANHHVKSFFSNKRDTDAILESITEFGKKKEYEVQEAIVFRGGDLPDFGSRRSIALHRKASAQPEEAGFYLGQPIEIANHDVFVPLRNEIGDNILLVGGENDVSESIALYGTLSLTTSHADNSAMFCLFNAMRPNDPLSKLPDEWFPQLPFQEKTYYINKGEDFEQMLEYVKEMVDERKTDASKITDRVYLTFFAFQLATIFDCGERDRQSKASQHLEYILKNGPVVGVSTILQVSSLAGLERTGIISVLSAFNHRVVMQMNEKDSNKLIGSSLASQIFIFNRPFTKFRAYYFDNNRNNIVKFKPYK